MKKRVFSFFLALCMMVTMLPPVSVTAQEDLTFSPDEPVTRGKFFYYLWDQLGRPRVSSEENPFEDISESDVYYTAVLWAVENNISAGTGANSFSPDSPCTRAQVATFLWRAYADRMDVAFDCPFVDVTENEYFYQAVLWACSEGLPIATYVCCNQFLPNQTCLFGHILGEGEKAGHSWDDGVVTLEPTTTAEGLKTFTCATCGEIRTEAIPVLEHEHNFSISFLEATCTEGDRSVHTCAICGQVEITVTASPLGHDSIDQGTPPTCEASGTRHIVCLRCGEVLEESVTPPLDHSWGQWVITREETEDAPGEKTRTCTRCQKTETSQFQTGDEPSDSETITFDPSDEMTRAMVFYYLWDLMGRPETEKDNPFSDLDESAYYYEAVLWAVENGITLGMGPTTFAPDTTCTRAQATTFLWRAFGSPEPADQEIPFSDVSEASFFARAILWAYQEGHPITTNLCGNQFAPQSVCLYGHIIGEGVGAGHRETASVTQATCTEQGCTTYTCSVCGAVRTDDVTEPLGHNYQESVIPPTCTDAGYTAHTCTRCYDQHQDTYVEAIGHDWDEGAFTDGSQMLYTCHNCGGTKYEPIAPHTHAFVSETTEVTCMEAGCTTHTCTLCGFQYVTDYVPAPEHDFVIVSPESPIGCTDYDTVRACTLCGEEIVSWTRNDHTWDEGVDLGNGVFRHTCTVCGKTNDADHRHEYQLTTDLPLCGNVRRHAHECLICDFLYFIAIEGRPEHEYAVNEVVAPTCWKVGYSVCYCIHCGRTKLDHYTNPAHTWGSWEIVTAPTEDTPGEQTATCTLCGETTTEIIPALGHDHSYTSVITAPTCTAGGYTTYTCPCGDTYTSDETAALGHAFGEWETVTEATEEAEGEEKRSCSRCDASETRAIPKLDHVHNYDSVVTEPTCTTGGFTTHTCSCGDSFTDTLTEPRHTFRGWEVVAEPTAEAEGKKQRDCIHCGHAEEQVMEKIQSSNEVFADVEEKTWFTDHVTWAVTYGITTGTTADSFSPNATCTRGQIVTFLWRAAGCPDPVNRENPFVDIKPSDYYYTAVLWAVEQEITSGVDATHFGPGQPCLRGQVVTFLWRVAGKPAVAPGGHHFQDVSEATYYYTPILWAAEQGITQGTGNGMFSPDQTCTRAQIVTFLFRAFGN